MSAQHTPGPWKTGHLGISALWVGPAYDQLPVALVPWDADAARKTAREDAAFIVRACNAYPDLLASLKEMLEAMDDGSDEPALVRARAAVAKAKGAA